MIILHVENSKALLLIVPLFTKFCSEWKHSYLLVECIKTSVFMWGIVLLSGPTNLSSLSQNTKPYIMQLTKHSITTITCLGTDRLPTWNIWEYAGTNMCKNFFYTQNSTYFYHITKNCLNFHFEAVMIKMCNAAKFKKC